MRFSKRTYFYGFKVFLVTTETGLPVEMAFIRGAWAETKGLEALPLNLPPNSELYGDSGFTNYLFEDLAREIDQIEPNIYRKKNSKRGDTYPISRERNSKEDILKPSLVPFRSGFLKKSMPFLSMDLSSN